MNSLDIVWARLRTQHITGDGLGSPEDVVQWLGAVQSQEYWGAKWSIAQRMKRGASDADLDRAFNAGKLLRTHILRPTWHFVLPADIRWMQRLTAPRVRAFMAYYDRMLELDRGFLDRCEAVIAESLTGGESLTRTELAARLNAAGIEAKGQRLGHIVMHTELDLLICSGPLKGKQHTYALLDERVPQSKKLTADEALAELTLRFFTGHGPAIVKDFMWWSSLTSANAKVGLEMVKERLQSEAVDGLTYWFAADAAPAPQRTSAAYLLPDYDESHIAYQDLKGVLAEDGTECTSAWISLLERPVVIGGRTVGTWKRTVEKKEAVMAAKLFLPPTPAQSKAIQAAADRYGKFTNMPVRLVTSVA